MPGVFLSLIHISGFIDLDYKLSGFQPSDLVLIAARPSMGKTAFVLNVVDHVAVRKKLPCMVFSLEMSKEQLVNRMPVSYTHLHHTDYGKCQKQAAERDSSCRHMHEQRSPPIHSQSVSASQRSQHIFPVPQEEPIP